MARESGWVAFWDRENRRAIALRSVWPDGERDGYVFVKHDSEESRPGVYDIWRLIEQGFVDEADTGTVGDIYCVQVHLDDCDDILGFPEHLLSSQVLGYPTLWAKPDLELPSFMSRFHGVSEPSPHDRLASQAQEFSAETSRFSGFSERSFKVGELLDNPKWGWAYGQGVYCFIVGGEVVYVGRALGATLGERIWNQLHSKDDPQWTAVVEDRDTEVRVYFADQGHTCMASAFEAYLIERLDPHPRFNRRRQ